MKEFKNGEYRMVLDGGGVVQVFRLKPANLTRTTITVSGERKSEPLKDSQLARHFERTPILKTCYSGDGWWHTDVEAGMSRWIGMQSGRAVSKALSKFFGFGASDVKSTVRVARKHQHKHMARACL